MGGWRANELRPAKGDLWHFRLKHEIIDWKEVAMPKDDKIDWSECPLIEVNAGVHSGAPVLRGTRMPADAIVDNFNYGLSVAEIAEQFQISQDRIDAILAYAQSHRVAHPV
jgi:uncharacterized protein (DUF433 family)